MTSDTADPLATLVPAAGLSLTTLPEATVALDCVVTVPNVRPAAAIAEVAADCEPPKTLGTLTIAGPEDTTRATAAPFAALVPAAGLSLMMSPEATVALDCVVTAPTARPAPVIDDVAADWLLPTTFGTDTELFAPPPEPPPPHAAKAVLRQVTRSA